MALMSEMEAMRRLARLIARNRENHTKIMAEAADTARTALANGMTEVDVAKALGVNRMTVRKWAGK